MLSQSYIPLFSDLLLLAPVKKNNKHSTSLKKTMDGWKILKSIHTSWGTQFVGRYDKAIAYGLILLLSFFSFLSNVLDWENYLDLASVDYRHSLLTGPPKPQALHTLFVCCVMGSVVVAIETVNAFTMMCNGGHVRIPVEVEQAIALLVVEIPLAAANLAIVMCRQNHVTAYQVLAGCVAMIKSGVRMYFYGWFKERYFKYERTMLRWTIKAAIIVSASGPYFIHFLIQCFTWHHATMAAPNSALSGSPPISIFLINSEEVPVSKYGHVTNFSIAVDNQLMGIPKNVSKPDLDLGNQWLVEDIRTLASLPDPFLTAYYDCQNTVTHASYETKPDVTPKIHLYRFQHPPTCTSKSKLKFIFRYERNLGTSKRQPFGEIQYGVAQIGVKQDQCYELESSPFEGGKWQLKFLRASVYNNTISKDVNEDNAYAIEEDLVPLEVTEPLFSKAMSLDSPWQETCVLPELHFSRYISVCP